MAKCCFVLGPSTRVLRLPTNTLALDDSDSRFLLRSPTKQVRRRPRYQESPERRCLALPPRAAYEPAPQSIPTERLDTSAYDDRALRRVEMMRLVFRDGLKATDVKGIVTEYARSTCAEDGVLRCDVLRPEKVAKFGGDGSAVVGEFFVWTTFRDSRARQLHEQTPHANKLRLLLARPVTVADNALVLAKLAREAVLFQPVWPGTANGWRSSMDFTSAPKPTSASDDASASSRASLDILVQNVGLENAIVLVASAVVSTDEYVDAANELCERYAEALYRESSKNGVVRVGLLSTLGKPRHLTIMQVHDAAHPDGALFETDLGQELFDADGWRVQRFVATFPDLSGWSVYALNDTLYNTPGKEQEWADRTTVHFPDGTTAQSSVRSLKEVYDEQEERKKSQRAHNTAAAETQSGTKTVGAEEGRSKDTAHPSSQRGRTSYLEDSRRPRDKTDKSELKPPATPLPLAPDHAPGSPRPLSMKLIHGNGAFAEIERRMRETAGLGTTDDLRVFVVCGWNQARIEPVMEELLEGTQAGRLHVDVGLSVFGASATFGKIAAGVSSARKFRANFVVAFGGGAVLDAAKAVSALLPLRPSDVSTVLDQLKTIAGTGQMVCNIRLGSPGVPLMLIPGTVGSGAEVSDNAILNTASADGSCRRISVLFEDSFQARAAIIDPRLVLARRMPSQDAAMGGLLAASFAIDALISPDAPSQACEFAEKVLKLAKHGILRARREPESSDGPARDILCHMSTCAALARDACGGPGVAAGLSIALLDGAQPTTTGLDAPLRTILPRVVAALLEVMDDAGMGSKTARPAQVMFGRTEVSGYDLVKWLLMTAEDIGTPLVAEKGIFAEDAARAAAAVVQGGLVSTCADSQLLDADLLERVVIRCVGQTYEL